MNHQFRTVLDRTLMWIESAK